MVYRGLSWSMVVQPCRFSRLSSTYAPFLCAQYLRASAHFVHSICATIQAWTPWSEGRKGLHGGPKAWDSQLTEFQSLSPLCAVRYAHRQDRATLPSINSQVWLVRGRFRYHASMCQTVCFGTDDTLRQSVLRKPAAQPALVPLGTDFSGWARTGLIPSAYPMSNTIPSETSPIIFLGSRLTTKSACLPSTSLGSHAPFSCQPQFSSCGRRN